MAHIMGTDNFGRDIFSRIMSGAWTTCFVAVCTIFIGAAIGTVIGAVTGYVGGALDNVIMRINDSHFIVSQCVAGAGVDQSTGIWQKKHYSCFRNCFHSQLCPDCAQRIHSPEAAGLRVERKDHGGRTAADHVCTHFAEQLCEYADGGSHRL